MKIRVASAALLLVGTLTWQGAGAQQSPTPTKPTSETSGEQNSGRMFGIIPAFNVTDAENAPPMTSGEKYHLALRSTVDPVAFLAAAGKAGFNQAVDFPAGFGQGGAGYGKRFGAAFADGASGKLLRTGVFPSLLHQDPRYFRKRQGSFKSRLGYSLSRTFVTRTDSREQAFNWSRILGSFGSAGLSNVYYPPENRGVQVTFVNVGYSLLGESLNNVLKEFWPDIQRRMRGSN